MSKTKVVASLLLAGLCASHAHERYFVVFSGSNESPTNSSAATGSGTLTLNSDSTLTYNISYTNLAGDYTASHIRGPAGPGTNAPLLFPLVNFAAGSTAGTLSGTTAPLNNTQLGYLRTRLLYANIHSSMYAGGEIRSQVESFSIFTYQGVLRDNGSPANGTYDLRFTLYDTANGTNRISNALTNSAMAISNGLFTLPLDFGGSAFNVPDRWLEVAARTNGGGAFTTLSPRQRLTPSPYAITAGSLMGQFPAMLNGSQTFTGVNVFASGGGAGRLIVSNLFTAVDTSFFTGLSLQFDANLGEGAIMSSYDDGYGFLSFYTKSGSGQPILRRMVIDKDGNVGIGTANPQQSLHVIGNILASGTITPNSDRNSKTNFAPVDTTEVLEKVARLPIQQWRFKSEPDDVKHFGPMAQDFRVAFGLGAIPTAIATVDADGVALAAIQGLNQKLEETRAENAELKKRLEELEQRLNERTLGTR